LAFLVQYCSDVEFLSRAKCTRFDRRWRVLLSERQGLATGQSQLTPARSDQTCVEKLSRLFPNALPVRIPVQVQSVTGRRGQLQEYTVIEFGTAQEVLFASGLPLEFEDRVRLANSDGSLDARAKVVAVRYHNGSKAVAARFLENVDNWIIKP
jgi:hypothetical protein